jgi:hypothetical protein
MLIFSHHFWLLSLVGYCSYLNMVKWLQQVEGFPVHSMATPTIGGARAVLTHLKAEPSFGVSGKKSSCDRFAGRGGGICAWESICSA